MVPTDLVEVEAEVARLNAALERPFVVRQGRTSLEVHWRIVQRCLVCSVELALTFPVPLDVTTVSAAWLHRELFQLYDDHRCDAASSADLPALLERTERESVRIASRAAALEISERDAPPETLGLFARAEREFVLLAELADHIERRLGRR